LLDFTKGDPAFRSTNGVSNQIYFTANNFYLEQGIL